MNGVIYARFSAGPRQTEQSIEGQVRDCLAYAEKNNITIIDRYIDRHVSGKDFVKREEFLRLMKDSQKKQFEVVLVWKQDRFGRDRFEILKHKAILRQNGVKLISVQENIPDGPEGILLESLIEGLAEYYSADLRQKVMRGMRDTALKGKAVSKICFGFKGVDRRYTVDPEKAPIVREIFRRYAAGESAPDIAADLDKRGIRGNKGGKITKNGIYSILRNEKYVGIYRFHEIEIPDAIPPLIEKDLWDYVQDKLSANTRCRSKSANSDHEYLLSGKAVCGECGKSLIGTNGTGKSGRIYYYYKCNGKMRHETDCTLPPLPTGKLEDAVLKDVLQNVFTDENIETIVRDYEKYAVSEEKTAYIRAIEAQIRDTEKKIKNLLAAIEDGIRTESTMNRLQELEKTKAGLDIELGREKLDATEYCTDRIRYFLISMRDQEQKESNEVFYKDLVDDFVDRIYVFRDQAIIAYNFTGVPMTRKELDAEVEEAKKKILLEQRCSDKTQEVKHRGLEPRTT